MPIVVPWLRFRARNVGDVGLPSAGVGALGKAGAASAAHRGRIFVAVFAGARVPGLQQACASLVRARAVDDEHSWPALANRALDLAFDVRVLRLGERDGLDA